MRYWSFRDFLSERGGNVVKEQLVALPKKVRAAVNTRVRFLEVTEKLDRPYVGIMTRECKGLMELRVKVGRVQYRPLACYGPDNQRREITILAIATERDGRLRPPNICQTALSRKEIIENNRERTCDHEFD